MMAKAMIAMSGGVDSSVTAHLVKEMGYETCGTMLILHGDGTDINERQDVKDAVNVARKLEIPFETVDLRAEFKSTIIKNFVETYLDARTPNPCILCNKVMKFGKLMEYALSKGCDKLATGHYASIEEKDGRFYLKKAVDEGKDQSYFLYNLNQELLSHILFPLGDMRKDESREVADKIGLAVAHKKDSQDVCFVPDGGYAEVVTENIVNEGKALPVPGDFVDLDGNVLGRHKGLLHYTIGQRRGLGLSLKQSMYVVRLDAQNNQVILGYDDDLFTDTLTARDFNWVLGSASKEPIRCKARVRYRHKEQPATVSLLDGNRVKIVFDEPQRAITSGQSAVLFDGNYVLGGGIIE